MVEVEGISTIEIVDSDQLDDPFPGVMANLNASAKEAQKNWNENPL